MRRYRDRAGRSRSWPNCCPNKATRGNVWPLGSRIPRTRQAARAAVSHVWALLYGRAAGRRLWTTFRWTNRARRRRSRRCWPTILSSSGFDLRRLITRDCTDQSARFRVDSRADFEIRFRPRTMPACRVPARATAPRTGRRVDHASGADQENRPSSRLCSCNSRRSPA